jgi:hypothetical protein
MVHLQTTPSATQPQLSIGVEYTKMPNMKDGIDSTHSIHGKPKKRNVLSRE